MRLARHLSRDPLPFSLRLLRCVSVDEANESLSIFWHSMGRAFVSLTLVLLLDSSADFLELCQCALGVERSHVAGLVFGGLGALDFIGEDSSDSNCVAYPLVSTVRVTFRQRRDFSDEYFGKIVTSVLIVLKVQLWFR